MAGCPAPSAEHRALRRQVGLSGGGPISADVQTFIRTAFCIPLIQGYALTETTCAGTIQMTSDTRPGVVGHPVGSVEIKLRSCLDAAGLPEATDRKAGDGAVGGGGRVLGTPRRTR